MRAQRVVRDVSSLPTYGFGPRMTMWWGTLAFCALEGTGFALAVGAYLYLMQVNDQWPLSAPPPGYWPGTVITVLLLASLWPNQLIKKYAKQENLRAVQTLLFIMSAVGLVAIAIRSYEFSHLNIKWDENAYGSIVWIILGLHTTHIVTDVGDTLVLTVLMLTRHAHGKRFSDAEDNAFYWDFVVLSWLPLYLLLYWVPRW
jgi:heme/copper-type cytochrome/quinol oxidase subunit 3